MRTRSAGRGVVAALTAAAIALPLVLGTTACASRSGSNRALSDGMVSRDRELARTPDEIDLDRPAWRRDWTPARDPYR